MTTYSPALEAQAIYSADGARLSVETAGHPALPAVVFIPDSLSLQTKECWDHQFLASSLPREYYLVRYDPRGSGDSSQPDCRADYSGARRAYDLHTVLTGLRIRQAVLVGSGWGGFVITEYLRHFGGAELVAGVAFVGAVTEISNRWRHLTHLNTIQSWIKQLSLTSAYGRPGHARYSQHIETLQEFVRTLYWQLPDQFTYNQAVANALKTPSYVIRTLLDQAEKTDSIAVLEEMDVPVLSLQGENDPFVQTRYSNFISSHTADSRSRIYRQVGHCPYQETAQFNRDLRTFLQQVYQPEQVDSGLFPTQRSVAS